ncbi:MAG: restriction endonuclease subunit S, partial [Coprococcus comes]
WEQRKLGDNIVEYTEKTTENNQYPVLTSSRKGIFFQTDYYDGNQIASADNTGYNIVPYGYFTYRHMSDDEIFHFNINDIAENGIVSTLYPVFTTDENLDSRYLQYQLNYGREFARYAILQKQGGSRTYMYLNKLRNLYLTVPTAIEEQKKISEYFTNLDHLITLHQRKYDETKTLKKYMLQKMFPQNGEKVPEIRFDGFTEDWEQRKLGEVCEIKDSARIPNSEWSESGIPYIRASDVTNENTDGVLFISQERYEFYKNRTGAPTKNDVLFNGGGEIGKSLLITDEKPIYVQGGAVLYARTSKSRELVGQYLKTYFETTNAKSYIDAASAGGTMRHFTLKPSQKMRILMPSVEEQEKIGGYFVNLDRLITLHQRKCNELKEIKKYMLQNMFV